MSNVEFWINITGATGLLVNADSLTRKSDTLLRSLIGLGFAFWTVNNVLLGAWTAAALCGVAMTRQIVASWLPYDTSMRLKSMLCIGFLSVILGLTLWTWNSWGSVLACISSFLSTVAMFYFSGARLRATVGFAYLFWCAATIWYHAEWAFVSNVLLTLAAFWGYFQLRKVSAIPLA